MLKENRFRTDLFYRLNVITLLIPPLRERLEDILPIANHLLKQIAHDCGLSEVRISKEAEDALMGYNWPGNARELSNVLERAVHYAERELIEVADLPRYLFQKGKNRDHWLSNHFVTSSIRPRRKPSGMLWKPPGSTRLAPPICSASTAPFFTKNSRNTISQITRVEAPSATLFHHSDKEPLVLPCHINDHDYRKFNDMFEAPETIMRNQCVFFRLGRF